MVAASNERFEIAYGRLRPLFSLFGLGPAFSHVQLTSDAVTVTMGWAFRARIARSAISGARRNRDMWGGMGVHGFGGTWLVNGTVRNIVTVEIDPPARAHVLGLGTRLRILHVSVSQPDAFVAALGSP